MLFSLWISSSMGYQQRNLYILNYEAEATALALCFSFLPTASLEYILDAISLLRMKADIMIKPRGAPHFFHDLYGSEIVFSNKINSFLSSKKSLLIVLWNYRLADSDLGLHIYFWNPCHLTCVCQEFASKVQILIFSVLKRMMFL